MPSPARPPRVLSPGEGTRVPGGHVCAVPKRGPVCLKKKKRNKRWIPSSRSWWVLHLLCAPHTAGAIICWDTRTEAKRSLNLGAHHHPGMFCKGLDFGISRRDAGLEHLSHGSRKVLGFPGESLSFQGGFSRSERQNLEAACKPGMENCNPGAGRRGGKPGSKATLLTYRKATGRTQCGKELPKITGI